MEVYSFWDRIKSNVKEGNSPKFKQLSSGIPGIWILNPDLPYFKRLATFLNLILPPLNIALYAGTVSLSSQLLPYTHFPHNKTP